MIKLVSNAVKILLVKSISADRKHLAICRTIVSIIIITNILLLNFHINLPRRVPYTSSCSDRYAYLCELDYRDTYFTVFFITSPVQYEKQYMS